MAEYPPPTVDPTIWLGEKRKEEEKNFLKGSRQHNEETVSPSDLDLMQRADSVDKAIEIIQKGF